MAHNYIHTMFGPGALARQQAAGSRASYARMAADADGTPDMMGEAEAAFIAARDSFYIASVTEHGWPYVQHRGGTPGFLKTLSGNRLAFADYRGNRQYISAANLSADARVALFLMDYPNRRRLKLIGIASIVERSDDPAMVDGLVSEDSGTITERAIIITVAGYDWNCPQHITPRFSEEQIAKAVAPLHAEIARLRAEMDRLHAPLDQG